MQASHSWSLLHTFSVRSLTMPSNFSMRRLASSISPLCLRSIYLIRTFYSYTYFFSSYTFLLPSYKCLFYSSRYLLCSSTLFFYSSIVFISQSIVFLSSSSFFLSSSICRHWGSGQYWGWLLMLSPFMCMTIPGCLPICDEFSLIFEADRLGFSAFFRTLRRTTERAELDLELDVSVRVSLLEIEQASGRKAKGVDGFRCNEYGLDSWYIWLGLTILSLLPLQLFVCSFLFVLTLLLLL